MKHALAVAGLTLGLGACSPHKPPPQRVALDCPQSEGVLTRASIAPDGRSCAYASSDGDQVSLRLIPVATNVDAALAPIEQELQADVRAGANGGATAAGSATATITATPSAAATGKAHGHASDEDGDDDADAADDSGGKDGNVTVNLPGIHVRASNGAAQVHVGGINIDAGDEGAVVRSAHDVRLRGEALSPVKRGYRASYILARDDLAGGYKAEGYEAAGPKTGPLAVAVVKSRSGGGEHDRLYHDVKALVRRNGGV